LPSIHSNCHGKRSMERWWSTRGHVLALLARRCGSSSITRGYPIFTHISGSMWRF
jgi:hypothetical protein